jgi:hypothetical protein
MAQLQSGIQVEVTPIEHKLHIELGKNLSTLLDEACRYAHNSGFPFKMTIQKDGVKLTIKVN